MSSLVFSVLSCSVLICPVLSWSVLVRSGPVIFCILELPAFENIAYDGSFKHFVFVFVIADVILFQLMYNMGSDSGMLWRPKIGNVDRQAEFQLVDPVRVKTFVDGDVWFWWQPVQGNISQLFCALGLVAQFVLDSGLCYFVTYFTGGGMFLMLCGDFFTFHIYHILSKQCTRLTRLLSFESLFYPDVFNTLYCIIVAMYRVFF